MHHESYISRLIYRRLIGTITPEEETLLRQWLDESEDNRLFLDSLADPSALTDEHLTRRVVDPLRPARDMELRIAARRRRSLMRRASRIAAAVAILIIAAGTAWHFSRHTRLDAPAQDVSPVAVTPAPKTIDDISAGTTRATITNQAGRTIALSAGESGRDGTTHFIPKASAEHMPPQQLCLEVPRGGEFKVILEDSTVVWLNSESTLRYPDTFSDTERRVAVTGEAYFSVSKDPSRPFYVESEGQVIRVYGTTFNVRAYPDEDATYTTLESGSISLARDTAPSGEIFLSKGHQAILDHSSDRVSMAVVDPAAVTSWRHGRFVFDDQPLERIMRDLSRWYDFRYEFADDSLRSRVFMGGIPRYADFRTAIQVLENCGGIRFTLTPDNKILISGL
ncbi:MAG: FecR domain-containing protein [Duncaniella sp.]|nr:FecR domain-containing protein [Duncaniella sp.]